METTKGLRCKFWIWISPAIVLFGVWIIVLLVRPSFCNSQPWFCGMNELRVTDVALVFLTYCLVIVGWFTMRSSDANTKNAERAYLVTGSLFGVPKEIPKDDELAKWKMEHRAGRSMFDGPWRMTIINFGKTAAYTTKVEWGLCPREEFLTDVPVSKLLDAPEHNNWRSLYMRGVVTVQDIFPPNPDKPLHYRHIEIPDEDIIKYLTWVFFGRITYKDVFKDEHYTTFSYHLVEEHADSIGKSLSDDHS